MKNLLTVWAEVLIDALASAGVRHVIVSPGSRSTPFIVAAARHASLVCHSVVDERSAAFYALGIARATSSPPLLLCTSGTAPAHYFPAVIEASEASLPLVVLSADRPFALAGCGAPQTIDQTRLYGEHVRLFAELGDPSEHGLAAMRRACARAVHEALAQRGPVHLNARAEKPLEPMDPMNDRERAFADRARSMPQTDVALPSRMPDLAGISGIAALIARAERPALIAGPLPIDVDRAAILAFAKKAGLALFTETTSQLRHAGALRDELACADAFDRWIDRAPTDATPDFVLELGMTPTSAAYARWIERGARRAVIAERFRDPSASAEVIAVGDVSAALAALGESISERAIDRRFARALAREEARAWSAVETALGEGLEEGAATRMLFSALPRDAIVALGNSLPIRHADRFVRGGADLRVISQRGANGIDGAIAGIAGAAIVDGKTAALLVGDVALLHDVGSLALAAKVRTPLAIVVLDNAGGRIFESLPIGRAGLDERALELFITPPDVDLAHAAAAFGVAYEAAHDRERYAGALARALERSGATLIHARVPPHGAAALEARILAKLEAS